MKSVILAFFLALVSSEILAAPYLKPYTEPPIPHTHHHGDHYHGERGAYDGQKKIDLDGQHQLSHGYDGVKKSFGGHGLSHSGPGFESPHKDIAFPSFGPGPHKDIGGYGSPSLGQGPHKDIGGYGSPSLGQGPHKDIGGFGSPSFSQGPHKDVGGFGSPSFSQGSGGFDGPHKNIGGLGSPSFSQGPHKDVGSGYSQSGAGSFSHSSAGSFSQSGAGSFSSHDGGHQTGLTGSGLGGPGSIGGHQSGSGFGGPGSIGGHQSGSGFGGPGSIHTGSGYGKDDYGHQTKVHFDDHKGQGGHGLVTPGHRIDSVGDRYAKKDEEHVRTGSSSFSTAYSSSQAGASSYKETHNTRY